MTISQPWAAAWAIYSSVRCRLPAQSPFSQRIWARASLSFMLSTLSLASSQYHRAHQAQPDTHSRAPDIPLFHTCDGHMRGIRQVIGRRFLSQQEESVQALVLARVLRAIKIRLGLPVGTHLVKP